jgi:dihydroorotase
MRYVIKHGHLIEPSAGISASWDVLVEDGRIVRMGPNLTAETVLDASGCVVCPGFVDVHVHFREPGGESKEDIGSGSRAAARGGYTSVVTMANTQPRIDNAGMVELVIRRARETACIAVYPAACATVGMNGERLTEMADLRHAGAVAVTDDGQDIANAAVLRRVLEYAAMVGLPYLAHCEDETLSRGGSMNEGYTSTALGLPGIPKVAEESRIDRNIRLAALAQAHIHIQHVTTAEGVRIIREAKARGLNVTCETAPHYWTLTDDAVRRFDTHAKMNPPLREKEDVAAIIEGIREGVIDCIATDHAPHTPTEKSRAFDEAPFGIIGLETALPLTLTGLVEPGYITLERAVELLTVAGARICNLPAGRLYEGGPADIAIFDPRAEYTITENDFASKSRNSPFLGRVVRGRVRYTIFRGEIVYRDRGIPG